MSEPPHDSPHASPAPPHGGELVDLLAGAERAAELRALSRDWPSWTLTPRQLADLELLATGAFSPLRGFLGRRDYESVRDALRLADGTLWPMPVTLEVSPELAERAAGGWLALREPEGEMLAALRVEEAWEPDREAEAQAVFGTLDPRHPGSAALLRPGRRVALAGRLETVALPAHFDFRELRRTPRELRAEFERDGWRRVVAFQTRNPMHRAHVELTLRAARELEACLLLHPIAGTGKPGDLDHYTRVRCYQSVLRRYPAHTARLALLPLAMRMGGPREALWHAIVRQNFGCTHFIVGRDHAGPGVDSAGKPFYAPFAAQELVRAHQSELAIRLVAFREMVWVEELDRFVPDDEVPAGARVRTLSGSDLRRRLADGGELPEWFTYPEVAAELRRSTPPRARQGFTVFFTGLSGAGKSTVARALLARLLEAGGRPVTLLDGDLVRRHLSSELGFSREHRDLNVRRIGWVASEITRSGGVAICAPIAPYDAARKEVRATVAAHGGFVLVHVATALEVCEARDRKGLYAKARAGLIPEFTGISDPYEAPADADLVLDTAELSPEEAAQAVLLHLEREGYWGVPAASAAG